MNNQSLRSYALKKIRMKIFPNENISEFNEIFKLPKDRMEAPKDNYWVLLSNKKIIKNVLEHTENISINLSMKRNIILVLPGVANLKYLDI